MNKEYYLAFVALAIEDTRDKIPLIIGEGIKPCPNCGKPLSFAYDHYFCRNCSYNSKKKIIRGIDIL